MCENKTDGNHTVIKYAFCFYKILFKRKCLFLVNLTSGVPHTVDVVEEAWMPSLHKPKSVKTMWPWKINPWTLYAKKTIKNKNNKLNGVTRL